MNDPSAPTYQKSKALMKAEAVREEHKKEIVGSLAGATFTSDRQKLNVRPGICALYTHNIINPHMHPERIEVRIEDPDAPILRRPELQLVYCEGESNNEWKYWNDLGMC